MDVEAKIMDGNVYFPFNRRSEICVETSESQSTRVDILFLTFFFLFFNQTFNLMLD